jgi:glutaryl-CoA dehydrogenase
MANPQATRAGKPDYAPPAIDGDFQDCGSTNDRNALLQRVATSPKARSPCGRSTGGANSVGDPEDRQIGGGVGYQGHGAAGGSWLLNGFVAMELARVDASVATFWGVHTGLSAGSIYLCGDEAQKQRWLPAMMRFEKIGSFGLTEPLVGSATSGGMLTTCRREGDVWILNGQKKWIGNATFAEINMIWAREEDSNQVKGFVVGKDNPGFSVEKIKTKMALRVVQNGLITLKDCRVPEADRLQNANSFKDTAKVLRMTRTGVAWFAVGCQMGAYEHALRYATERIQFGKPIGGFQLVQDLLVRMLGNVTSTQAAAGRRGDAGRACIARESILHCQVPRDGRLCARAARRQRHPAREPHRPVRGRRGGDLLLRGHQGNEHVDRRQVHHRAECLRLTLRNTGFPSGAASRT